MNRVFIKMVNLRHTHIGKMPCDGEGRGSTRQDRPKTASKAPEPRGKAQNGLLLTAAKEPTVVRLRS